jgi:ABC-type ATPase involved in cell division
MKNAKKRHLWIYGPTNTGKSSLIKFLAKKAMYAVGPNTKDVWWDNQIVDQQCVNVVFDEFEFPYSVDWYKRLMDG